MCVKKIPKSKTFGVKDEWQVGKSFRAEILNNVNDWLEDVSDAEVEEIICVLVKMGYAVFSD